MKLSYLETVWSFGSCFQDLLGGAGTEFNFRLIIPHYQDKAPEYSTQ